MRPWKAILSVMLVLALGSVVAACPNCKDAIAAADSAGAPGISGAFNSSVYVMLGAFLAVLGMVAGIIIKGIRSS